MEEFATEPHLVIAERGGFACACTRKPPVSAIMTVWGIQMLILGTLSAMVKPVTVNDVLEGHVALDVETTRAVRNLAREPT